MLEVQSIKTEPIMNDKKSILFKIKTNDPAEIKNLISWYYTTRDFLINPISATAIYKYKDCILMCRDSGNYLKSEFLVRGCFVKLIHQNGAEVEAEIYSSYAPDEFNLEEYSKSNYKLYLTIFED